MGMFGESFAYQYGIAEGAAYDVENRIVHEEGAVQPGPGLLELYSDPSGKNLGIVATRYELSAPYPTPSMISIVIENVERVGQRWLSPESKLVPILRAMGLAAHRRVVPNGVQHGLVVPASAEQANEHLATLHVTDRRFVPYNGAKYSAREGVGHAAKGEFLLARDFPHGLHDLALHYAATALVPPSLLECTKARARQALEGGGIKAIMTDIDLMTLLVPPLTKAEGCEVKESYAAIIPIVAGSYQRVPHCQMYAEDAIKWRDELTSRAQELQESQ